MNALLRFRQSRALVTPLSPLSYDLPWLKEVHEYLESRGPYATRFPRAKAHHAALKNRLNVPHSDRDLPGCDRKRYVPSAELDFLPSEAVLLALSTATMTTLKLVHSFPSALMFLDLTTWDTRRNCRPVPLPQVLRRIQEYDEITNLIKGERQNNGGSVIVYGQRCTGKFLVFPVSQDPTILADIKERCVSVLWKRNGRPSSCPFFYQSANGTMYHVAEICKNRKHENHLHFGRFFLMVYVTLHSFITTTKA